MNYTYWSRHDPSCYLWNKKKQCLPLNVKLSQRKLEEIVRRDEAGNENIDYSNNLSDTRSESEDHEEMESDEIVYEEMIYKGK